MANENGTDQLDWKLEWERGRQILEKGDEQIIDLRKVGFSFITGLITASAYRGGKDTPVAAGDPVFTGSLVALTATAGIAALFFCDEEIAARQRATAARLGILERFTVLELTDFLRCRASTERWDRFRRAVYSAFVVAAFIVGAAGPSTVLCGTSEAPQEGEKVTAAAAEVTAIVAPDSARGAANETTKIPVSGDAKKKAAQASIAGSKRWARVCLFLNFLAAVLALGGICFARYRLLNSPKSTLRPGLTDWTLSTWTYDSRTPVFLQIANQATRDDHVPYANPEGFVIARLRPLSPHARSHDLTHPTFNSIGGKPRPHWLLRAETTMCLPIDLGPDPTPGWYEVIIAAGGVLKRRLLVTAPKAEPEATNPTQAIATG